MKNQLINNIINSLIKNKTMEQIKLKQVGQNLIAIIDGKQYSKMFANKEERESVKNKVLLYNKKPTKALHTTILKLIDKTIIEKEVKVAKEKGIKKAIAKVKKEKVTKKKDDKKDLVTEVEHEFKARNFDKAQIERLEALLRKKKEALKEETPVVVKAQDNTDNSYGRERNR